MRGKKLDPRTEESLRIVSAAKNKDVNAVQGRAWSLPEERRTEEKKKFPQCAGWLQESQSAISSVVLLSVAFVPSLPLCSCLWSCLSALRVAMGLNVWASPWIAAPEFCCDAMARARSVAHAHHERNKIANLSYFPKVYLLFVCEEDKYNCFNLRSHKGNWIFFVIESNSDMKAFQCIWSPFKLRILKGTCPRLLYYRFYALFKSLAAY